MYLVCGQRPTFDDFRPVQNFSANTRVYAGKWSTMVYHLQMAKFWSILGPRTNLIDGNCSKFNGEMGDVLCELGQ
jgi:hypothetical protein